LLPTQSVSISDKQQEVDIQSLRAQQDDSIDNSTRGGGSSSTENEKSGKPSSGTSNRSKAGTMSQISGVRRSLSHANSLPAGSAPLPKFGVPTDKEPELAEVKPDQIIVNTKITADNFSLKLFIPLKVKVSLHQKWWPTVF
jgi:hypothetical protein